MNPFTPKTYSQWAQRFELFRANPQSFAIARAWNMLMVRFLDRHYRRHEIRHLLRSSLRCIAPGKGNKAWKRVAALDRQAGVIIWPDYALPTRKAAR